MKSKALRSGEKCSKISERIIKVFQAERERLPSNKRWQYNSESRLEILQIMQLAGWSTKVAAKQFGVHPSTIRSWKKALRDDGSSSSLFTAQAWNRIHDSVRWAVHLLRRMFPEAEFGTRTIARYLVRAGIQIHRSSVQRILREDPPKGYPAKPPMVPPEGAESTALLKPTQPNMVWHMDIIEVQLLWMKFSIAAVINGFTRRIVQMPPGAALPRTPCAYPPLRRGTAKISPSVYFTVMAGNPSICWLHGDTPEAPRAGLELLTHWLIA